MDALALGNLVYLFPSSGFVLVSGRLLVGVFLALGSLATRTSTRRTYVTTPTTVADYDKTDDYGDSDNHDGDDG
ncbi:hypothetical protein BDW22DRAFT_1362118 [Trametopsis cervina]|nr:hypothetical protein BDW22DRAFT_1362118 [Trametopsis cervina]